jgi:serine/threonine-protein kinase
MDSARWEQIQKLFHAALALSGQERRRLLDAQCETDAELHNAIEEMLQADEGGTSLLDRGIQQIAYEMLVQTTAGVDSPPAAEFGPYRLIRLLGEGGMGVVWLAERTDTNTLVAIKFLPNAGLSPARRERFTHEIRTVAKLKHPYIARLYDAGALSDGTPWFVMEYVQGVRFTEYCLRGRAIEEQMRLFRSVCEAVQYSHGQEIIHRDLKPSNILVEADGTPKLLDFGIARELQQLDERGELTRKGPRFMSPHYAAPEWVRENVVGFSTDVYSLGVILYEILTGRLPFPEGNQDAGGVEQGAVRSVPDKPSWVAKNRTAADGADGDKGKIGNRIPREAWNDLDVLCLKAMHADPVQRYASVEALTRDIDHFLRGEPLEARPDSLIYRCSKFIRRNRSAVLSTVAAVALVIGLVGMFLVRLAQARNEALAAAAHAERIQHFTLSLFQGNDKVAGAADNLSVVTLVDRGVQEAKSLSQDKKEQADIYQTLGTMYDQLGKLDKADALIQTALFERESLPESNSAAVAESQMTLAQLRSDENRSEEAEQLARQAVALIQAKDPKDRALAARADSALGSVLVGEGKYKQGVELLKRAVPEQSRQRGSLPDLAETLSYLGQAYIFLGNYDEANSVNRTLLALDRQIYSADDPHLTDALEDLEQIQEQRGNYFQAEQYGREALRIDEAWYGKDHPETADMMTALAGALIPELKYSEADQLLQRALATQKRVYGAKSTQVAFVLNHMETLAFRKNDMKAALKLDNQCIEIYRSSYGKEDYKVGVTLSNRGSIYLKEDQYRKAEKEFREAMQILTKTQAADSMDNAIVQVKLGRVLMLEQRYREAEKHTRAGFEDLIKQGNPQLSYLHDGEGDLEIIYAALKQPMDTQKVRGELAAAETAHGLGHHTR